MGKLLKFMKETEMFERESKLIHIEKFQNILNEIV